MQTKKASVLSVAQEEYFICQHEVSRILHNENVSVFLYILLSGNKAPKSTFLIYYTEYKKKGC